jgi:hypothetical protein
LNVITIKAKAQLAAMKLFESHPTLFRAARQKEVAAEIERAFIPAADPEKESLYKMIHFSGVTGTCIINAKDEIICIVPPQEITELYTTATDRNRAIKTQTNRVASIILAALNDC